MGTWHLSLRVDRLVEGCEVGALAYLYQKSVKKNKQGVALEAACPAPPPSSAYELRFRWLRGPEAPVCANRACPIANDFSPLVWSQFARKDARSVQCVDAGMQRRMGVGGTGAPAVFCSSACFVGAWEAATAGSSSRRRGSREDDGGGPDSLGSSPAHTPRSPLGGGADSGSSGSPRVGGDGANGGNGDLAMQRPLAMGIKGEDRGAAASPRDRSLSSVVDLARSKTATQDAEEIENGGAPWAEVGSDKTFLPTAADVGRRFRLECTAVALDGTHLFGPRSIRTEPVLGPPPAPPKRALVAVKGASTGGGYRFRVLSYNILAEIYATQHMYPHCDFWALGWGYRLPNLLRELRDAAADVMCLQEVQADHYERHLKPWLGDQGFDGLYKQKTRESMGAAGKVDGCAIFWRRSKFRLSEHYGVEFNDCARTQAANVAVSDDHEREILGRLMKDNIATVAVLEVLLPGGGRGGGADRRSRGMGPLQVAVANTHLYSNKECPDVKLWQCLALVRELEQLVLSRDLPLVICGDFNSVPSSAVYDLLARSAVPEDHPDLGDDALRVLPTSRDELSHQLDLVSAYASVTGAEPPYTNFTAGFTGVLDYVWCSVAHLRPLAVVPVPLEEHLRKAGTSLPNVQFSSDHVLLCCDLQLGGTVNPDRAPGQGLLGPGSSSGGQPGSGGGSGSGGSGPHPPGSAGSMHHGQQPGPPPPPPPPPPMMGASDFPSLGPSLGQTQKKRDGRR